MMIKNYSKYIKEEWNLFGKEKKEEPVDWREQIEGTYRIDSINNFFNIKCRSSEKEFIKYLHKLCFGKQICIEQTGEKFMCREVFLKKGWDVNRKETTLQVWIVDNNGNLHSLPAEGNIHFILPEKKISKIDPYGEENWDL